MWLHGPPHSRMECLRLHGAASGNTHTLNGSLIGARAAGLTYFHSTRRARRAVASRSRPASSPLRSRKMPGYGGACCVSVPAALCHATTTATRPRAAAPAGRLTGSAWSADRCLRAPRHGRRSQLTPSARRRCGNTPARLPRSDAHRLAAASSSRPLSCSEAPGAGLHVGGSHARHGCVRNVEAGGGSSSHRRQVG